MNSEEKAIRDLKKRAAGLLSWLIDFLPGTIPSSAEDAILDVSEDVHALFWHRSELQSILKKHPDALSETQMKKLAKLDHDIRSAALLLVGSGKGMLRRYREGRYDRSHWWWYLDDMLQEEAIAESQKTIKSAYRYPAEGESLQKVADRREGYGKKRKTSRRAKK
jgi:hypothetical protein